MPAAWNVEFYEADEGCPVRGFLDGLGREQRAKVLALIHLLVEQGPTLPFPYSSQIRGKLRELRTRFGNEHFRVLYFGAPGRVFVLLHALSKRTAKLPAGDIVKAETRMKRYLEQLDEE
jgi:phage-related protein